MEELGKIHQLIIPVFGYNITLNLEVIVMTWIVFFVLIVFWFFYHPETGPVAKTDAGAG